MKYCYQCGRITPGEPIYCNSCGRSYDVKRCPRGHANPRSAEACSICGSRDLSTPQPRVPLGVRFVAFLLSLFPGCLVTAFAIVLGMVFIEEVLRDPRFLSSLVLLGIVFGILAWMWSEMPLWFRKLVRRLLESKRKEDRS